MDSVGVWGEAWLTCNQGNPVLHLTAVSFGGGGGGLLVQFSPPPILQMGKQAQEQLSLHRLTSLLLVPSQEVGEEGRGLVVVNDAALKLDVSLTR